MKKVLFKDLKAGQIFQYEGVLYSKLSSSLTVDQIKRCNIAKSYRINAIRVDKTDGLWFDSFAEVEMEQK